MYQATVATLANDSRVNVLVQVCTDLLADGEDRVVIGYGQMGEIREALEEVMAPLNRVLNDVRESN